MKQGECGEECLGQMREMLERYELPTTTDYSAEQLIGPMKADKKRSGNTVSFILLREIGQCFSRLIYEKVVAGLPFCVKGIIIFC